MCHCMSRDIELCYSHDNPYNIVLLSRYANIYSVLVSYRYLSCTVYLIPTWQNDRTY